MAIPSLFNTYIDETYQRIVQVVGNEFADGTGSAITFGTTAPAGPNTSLQFNGNGVFSGSSALTFNSASNALTLTGSLNITGSTLQVGNNTLVGNTILSGSINISGSSTIQGTTTMTGSLLITGSTTQIGNNTLLGDTILSGSITISGSFPVGSLSSSVNIYGDTTMTGFLKFEPYSTNIDTTISASYIFVSGSTNDLYFAQNTNGYNNITRLRWLEGNLYSGLLNGGIISQLTPTTYQVSSGSGVIISLNATLNDNPYPTAQYLNWGNLTSNIAPLSASYDQQFVAINSSSAIFAQGFPYSDGDYNTKIPIGIVIHQNRSTINAVQTFPSVGYGWKQRSFDFIKAFGPLKIAGYTLSPSSSLGLLLAGGTAWVDGRNYIVDPNNPSYITEATGITTSKIYRYYQSGSTWQSAWGYNTNAGTGFTTIDPTQYSNAGTLTPLSTNNKWSIQRVFYFPNSATKAFYIYYGNAEYANKSDAISAIQTEPFNEAPNTAANAIFVGYMILEKTADFTSPITYEFRAAGLFRASGIGGSGGGGGATTLAALTDVSLTSPSYGDLLMYDSTYWYNTKTLSGSYILSGSLTTNDGVSVQTLTASIISASQITGSLFGTASYATTASYALNGGVTKIQVAGSGLSISPVNGTGQVTITSTGGSGIYGNTATGSYGSFFSTQTQTASLANIPYSMSFDNTDISNGVSISGSASASIKLTNAGVYNIQFSAQLARSIGSGTENVLIWLRKNGTDLAWTNTDVTLAGSTNVKQVAAWNWFVNAAADDYCEIMWSTTTTNIELQASTTPDPDVPSVILTVNRVDQFLSNTGSFSGSFNGSFTGSLLGTASTASYYQETDPIFVAKSASLATTGSNQFNGAQSITGSVSILNGNLNLTSNAYFLQGTSTINNNVSLIGVGSDDQIQIGNISYLNSIRGNTTLTGSLSVSAGITGSLFGTASWAYTSSRAITASNTILQATLLTNQTVGGVGSGTTYQSGSSLETIIRNMLVAYIPPTLSNLTMKSGSITISFNDRDVNNFFQVNTASFSSTADNPNGVYPLSSSFTASGADVGTINYYFGDNVLFSTNNRSIGSTYTINRATTAGSVTFSVRGKRADTLANITDATSTVNFYWRNYLGASSTIVNSDATAQTVVDNAVDSLLTNNISWTATCTADNKDITKYTYIIYPASYGNLNIVSQNGTQLILDPGNYPGAFADLGNFTVTNLYGSSISVKVYKTNAAGAFASGVTLVIS